MQIHDQNVPFSFSTIHKILTLVCFTMFHVEQTEIKISKSFQIKAQYVYVRRYQNWYKKLKPWPFVYCTKTDNKKLKPCPFMYIMD